MTRRQFLLSASAALAQPARRPNILLLIADDLNTDLGCYGHPYVATPNLDRLARRGARFERAYAQYPVCNPSRTSFLSGLYPEQTGVLDNRINPQETVKQVPFLPALLRRHGYFTARIGKIYHDGMDGAGDWDVNLNPRGAPAGQTGEGRNLTGGKFSFFAWRAAEGTDDDQPDGQTALEAIRVLSERPQDKPFFLAVGLRKPHDQYVAPKKYFDAYPLDRIPGTPGPADDEADMPKDALPPVRHNLGPQEGKEFRRAYAACTTFMDAQAGRVLDALPPDTLVIFFGDHGLHHGEHGWWNKVTLFDRSARVPLIVAGPGVAAHGQTRRQPVQLVDLAPTVADYCGIPKQQPWVGASWKPLLANPEAPWDRVAYSVVVRQGGLGRSVAGGRYRYTEWPSGSRELFDHETDPHEYRNAIDDVAYAGVAKRMAAKLAAIRLDRP